MKKLNIGLIGYGKMGREVHQVIKHRGHHLAIIIDIENITEINNLAKYNLDVCIEFSKPEHAVENIKKCFAQDVPVVCGTTGWYQDYEAVKKLCEDNKHSLIASSNFSIGVNIFFKINQMIAEYMNAQNEYDVEITEIHHTQKLDAPSGTAIVIAQKIMEKLERKNNWVCNQDAKENELKITAQRIAHVPGTHIVNFSSEIDSIELKHTANNRKGFAQGAVHAAEFIHDKKGCFTMNDILFNK